jgi:hypothetical protein
MQHGGLVDRPVHRTGLDAHDVRHRVAFGGGGLAGVGRHRRGRRQRDEVAGGIAVHVVHAGVDRARGRERGRQERTAREDPERFGLADEGRLPGTAEHRTLPRMVRHLLRDAEAEGTLAAVGLHRQRVGAVREPSGEHVVLALARLQEVRRDLGPVDQQLGIGAARDTRDPEQRVTAADPFRLRRHDRQRKGSAAARVADIFRLHVAAAGAAAPAGRQHHGGRQNADATEDARARASPVRAQDFHGMSPVFLAMRRRVAADPGHARRGHSGSKVPFGVLGR